MNTPPRPHLRILVGEASVLWLLSVGLGVLGWLQGLQVLLGAAVVLLPWALSSTTSALAERRRTRPLAGEGVDPQRGMLWIWGPLITGALIRPCASAFFCFMTPLNIALHRPSVYTCAADARPPTKWTWA